MMIKNWKMLKRMKMRAIRAWKMKRLSIASTR
jgi:hypothetical protein